MYSDRLPCWCPIPLAGYQRIVLGEDSGAPLRGGGAVEVAADVLVRQ